MKKRIPDFSHPKAANLMLVEPERASLVPLFVVLYDWQRNIWSIRTNNSSLVPHRSTHISLYLSLSLSHTILDCLFFLFFNSHTRLQYAQTNGGRRRENLKFSVSSLAHSIHARQTSEEELVMKWVWQTNVQERRRTQN